MRIAPALLLTLLAAPLAAQESPAPTPQAGEQVWDGVVAVVGDTVLLRSDVLLALEQLRASGQQVPTDPAQYDALVDQVVHDRVNDLVLLEAARRAGVSATEADVLPAVEQQIQQVQQRFGSQQAMMDALARSGRTLEQYRHELMEQYLSQTTIERFVRQRLAKMPPVSVSQDEMREFFDQQKERLGARPANLSFQQVIVEPQPSDSAKAAARRKAEKVLEELRAGGDFAVLAKRYSDDPSAEHGGELGWFREGQMVRPFEAAAWALRPGQTSGIVETQFGYHIIKLEKVRGPERQASHILIRPEITDADVARARERADSVAQAIRGGASVTQLAAQYNTPAEQRVNRNVPVDKLPEAYAAALKDAQPGAVVGPFEAQGGASGKGFVVAKVTDRQAAGEYALQDVEEQVRQRVEERKQFDQLLAELRRSTYISIKL